MAKIKCPQCGNEIELDKNTYNDLLGEIATEEVNKRVNAQMKAMEESYKAKLALEQEKAKIAQEKEIAELKQKNASLEEAHKVALELAKTKAQADFDKQLAELKQLNATLVEQLKNSGSKTELEVAKAVNEANQKLNDKELKITQLTNDVANAKKEIEQVKLDLKEKYEFELKAAEEEVEKWKSFRLGSSTKALGESLEQYCSNKFEEVRAYAFPRAEFKKDNDVDEEGKGDFIFRDFTEDGTEFISIMFEMKNQNDTSKTKQKNEQFFEKLDKNRTTKGCEYAVLVSTLEETNELYNSGIVDKSYQYPKMYVIRPQHFIAIIGLLRNMALSNVAYQRQVAIYQKENVDITNFEKAVQAVADKISQDYEYASKQYESVEKMCDDMIKKLQDFKETFRVGQGWILKAQNQLPNLEIRKLTHGNPTMKQKFEELKDKK